MPKWYQRATWSFLRGAVAPSVLGKQGFNVSETAKLPDEAFVLLSDHANSLDPVAIGAVSRRPIRFMANIEGVHPLKGIFAGLVGAYGRRKGSNDVAALRRTLELAAAGESIGLFPEGDRCWDGGSQALRPGCARLVKRLGLPLVLVRQKGNYLAHPRWARKPRKGDWSLEWTMFDTHETERLSEGLLEAIIARSLEKNEIKDAIAEGREFKGEGLAEGVERFLWQCPVCGKSEDKEGRGTALLGRGDGIECVRCGARWKMDANLRIVPINTTRAIHIAEIGDLKDWGDWQRQGLAAQATGRGMTSSVIAASNVALSQRKGGAYEQLGRGSLRLNDGELLFETSARRIVFPASEVKGFVDNFSTFSEFGHGGERWRIDFGEGNIAKWCYAFEVHGPAFSATPGRVDADEGVVA